MNALKSKEWQTTDSSRCKCVGMKQLHLSRCEFKQIEKEEEEEKNYKLTVGLILMTMETRLMTQNCCDVMGLNLVRKFRTTGARS